VSRGRVAGVVVRIVWCGGSSLGLLRESDAWTCRYLRVFFGWEPKALDVELKEAGKRLGVLFHE